jgi:AraC-like DNA-binding protein
MHQLSCETIWPKDELSAFFYNTHVRLVSAKKSEHKAPWLFRAAQGMASFYVVVNGACRLQIDGEEDTHTLCAGDLAVLLSGKGHWLQDNEEQTGINPVKLCGRTTLVRGHFNWDENELAPLLPELPDMVHFKNENGLLVPWMARIIQMVHEDQAANRLGARTIINHIAYTIFIQSIRAHLVLPRRVGGQVMEFRHYHQIGQALHQIHNRLEEPWSLNKLARNCGMSRSGFADEFKRATGKPPMAYLMDRRMDKACELLRGSSLKIKEVSALSGYGSQPAFSNAFRRWAGMAPGTYRKAGLGTTWGFHAAENR